MFDFYEEFFLSIQQVIIFDCFCCLQRRKYDHLLGQFVGKNGADMLNMWVFINNMA